MTLCVRIRRKFTESQSTPVLEARVVSKHKDSLGRDVEDQGEDLLKGRRFTVLDNAISACDKKLMKLFKLVDPPAIEWLIPEEMKQEAINCITEKLEASRLSSAGTGSAASQESGS